MCGFVNLLRQLRRVAGGNIQRVGSALGGRCSAVATWGGAVACGILRKNESLFSRGIDRVRGRAVEFQLILV